MELAELAREPLLREPLEREPLEREPLEREPSVHSPQALFRLAAHLDWVKAPGLAEVLALIAR